MELEIIVLGGRLTFSSVYRKLFEIFISYFVNIFLGDISVSYMNIFEIFYEIFIL